MQRLKENRREREEKERNKMTDSDKKGELPIKSNEEQKTKEGKR